MKTVSYNLFLEFLKSIFVSIEKYAKENFCLDYSMEYCDNVSEPQFVAVLNDQNLHDNWRNSHATSVFGGGGGDTMLIFKQVGFGISLFFLFLTLAIHFVVPDMRKVCYTLRPSKLIQLFLFRN